MGGAYLAGGASRTSDDHQRSARLARAAARGFSEGALRAETQSMGPGALALAQHRDPLAGAGPDHDGQAVSLRVTSPTALAASATPAAAVGRSNVMRASFTRPANPAARPFRFPTSDALQSARDLDCLADAVYYEARGETSAGQAAVAQVVLNRVRHPGFPKSVCGVVFQGVSGDGCQFSFACDGSMRHTKETEAWRRAEQIAARALTGFVMPSVGNATHFHVVGVDPGWGPRLLKVAQVGLHVFYRFGGYAGAPSSFTGEPERSVPDSPAAEPTLVAGATADGRPAGQIILASATLPAQASAAPSAASVAKPAGALDAPAAAKPEPGPVKAHADTGL